MQYALRFISSPYTDSGGFFLSGWFSCAVKYVHLDADAQMPRRGRGKGFFLGRLSQLAACNTLAIFKLTLQLPPPREQVLLRRLR